MPSPAVTPALHTRRFLLSRALLEFLWQQPTGCSSWVCVFTVLCASPSAAAADDTQKSKDCCCRTSWGEQGRRNAPTNPRAREGVGAGWGAKQKVLGLGVGAPGS